MKYWKKFSEVYKNNWINFCLLAMIPGYLISVKVELAYLFLNVILMCIILLPEELKKGSK